MKTNKLSKFLIAAALLSGTSLIHAAGNQGQGSGQVKFHGYIIDAPCSIVSDDPILVEFGQISKRVLADGGKSHIEPFQIELADCDFSDPAFANQEVAVTFSYTTAGTVGNGPNLIGLDGLPNSGAGVAIVSGNTQVQNGVALPVQKLQTGPNTLEFSSFVQGLDTTVPVQEGEFYANANFTLTYS